MKQRIIGVDEVGRGALAGPVAVAAFDVADSEALKVLPLKDSKQLSKQKRETVYEVIREEVATNGALYAVSYVPPEVIDEKGISAALRAAVSQALEQIEAAAQDTVMLDGSLRAPTKYTRASAETKGDERFLEIALASIVAKVERDRKMSELARRYPEYHFDTNVGYGTKAHRDALMKYGSTPHHRVSFCGFLAGRT